jgi:Holliday junction resolvase-like predicted endonuclease
LKVQSQGIGGVFLERAAAEELASKLTSGGWEVQREAQFGALRVDLVARRGEEVVFYEFKLAGASANDGWARQLLSYQKLARQHGAAFRLVMVRPPRQMDLEIDGVESMLFEFLVQHPPSEVSDIAGHTLIDEVVGVDLVSVRISRTIADISGDASLAVTLQTGAGENIGSEIFPFAFSAKLDLLAQRADDVHVFQVDTSSWYGDERGDDEDVSVDPASSSEDADPF